MTLFLNFYILVYIFTLIQIQFLLNLHKFNIKTITIPYLFYYITKFSKLKNILLLFIISMSGIPPFILFYIKFNFLINLLYKFNFLNIILVYLSLFLNMLFYVQIFFFKNVNYSLKINKIKCYTNNFFFIFYSMFFLFFIIFSFFFFPDIFFIVKLLYIL